MKSQQTRVRQLLTDQGGAISFGCAPDLIGSIRRMARNGELSAVLPGVFCSTAQRADAKVRMQAVLLRDPDAVFTGFAAAHLLMGAASPDVVTATGRVRGHHPGIELTRRRVDPDWVTTRAGVRCTAPELTAIDLIPARGADYVDQLLRESGGRGSEALARMWQAHRAHPDRAGNQLREAVLTESRDLPWSAAERRAHAQLRQAGLSGWVTNHRVAVADRIYFLDVAVPQVKLDLEIDGFETHGTRDSFENDRRRQNDLVGAGWTVLRVTWAMLQNTDWLAWLAPWGRALLATSSPRWPT